MVVSGKGFKSPTEEQAFPLKTAEDSDMRQFVAFSRFTGIQREATPGVYRHLLEAVLVNTLKRREIKNQVGHLQIFLVVPAVQKGINRVDP
jgi:hypothetical protein